MKLNEFREQIIRSIKAFVRKYKPAVLNIQCPLTIEVVERRQANYRARTCKSCRWRSNVYNGETASGEDMYYCRRMTDHDCKVTLKTPACPWYED